MNICPESLREKVHKHRKTKIQKTYTFILLMMFHLAPDTLPGTNIAPENDGWNTSFLSGNPTFQVLF